MPPHCTELMFISLINFKLGRRQPNQPLSTYLTCHWLVLQLPISRLIMHDNSTIPIATTRPLTFPHFPRLPLILHYGDSNLDISGLYDKPRGMCMGIIDSAPLELPQHRTPTRGNNMSAYMWDAGLWGEQVPNLGG
ncbi:LOW QUALITY PROTEIN: hypothetical protein QC762_210710 [Podospora pseudocomata]|uniref:Uncharacterized protein n=1 Tax=Podospora pseudocomata TaxID=2093779 RepID=A0ABR0GN50_9PEZI|nr:LOW QUALITY PROTEIN: hypothetical protein QC762_210710 [Podospora pseudocomata]